MNATDVSEYYNNGRVIEQIFSYSQKREISVALREGGHMSRPNAINYPRDIREMVRRGGVSFHGTVEHWKNPVNIRTGMGQTELNELRTGWDLIIDIDSAIGLEAAKLAAGRVMDFLDSYGVSAGVKFSGNRGFHIGVPWESLPHDVDYVPASAQFPKLPRIIATFIKESIKDALLKDLKKMRGSLHELIEELGGTQATTLSPYLFVDIENNWGERHLFRLPYSLNEKSWLVSVPISRDELSGFRPEHASPSRVVRYKPHPFLEARGTAESLVGSAVDWHSSRAREERVVQKPTRRPNKEVAASAFPPCIKLIMGGLADGRKRSILVLVNFLQQMNWQWERVESAVRDANAKNRPPLPDAYVNGQLNWFRRAHEAGRQLLPPNCANSAFYTAYGICQPDERCKRGTDSIQIKNPTSYPFVKALKR
ncbi:MAG: hypothetical protein HY366_02855 [Candidatus Aenigmarchaeota archaeon]|nr:hypothetical protein [Candidatus Aenigmarchaeota archaeon]